MPSNSFSFTMPIDQYCENCHFIIIFLQITNSHVVVYSNKSCMYNWQHNQEIPSSSYKENPHFGSYLEGIRNLYMLRECICNFLFNFFFGMKQSQNFTFFLLHYSKKPTSTTLLLPTQNSCWMKRSTSRSSCLSAFVTMESVIRSRTFGL